MISSYIDADKKAKTVYLSLLRCDEEYSISTEQILFSTQTIEKQNNMDKIIIETAVLNFSTKDKAFEMFTTNKNLENWLTAKANAEAKIGGKYELFWEPDDPENNSTIGCKILAIDSPNFLNFEWKGPKQFKHFMNDVRPLTNVTVIFTEQGDRILVTLIHTGWRDTDEWEQARQYFINAWKGAFSQLEKYVNEQ